MAAAAIALIPTITKITPYLAFLDRRCFADFLKLLLQQCATLKLDSKSALKSIYNHLNETGQYVYQRLAGDILKFEGRVTLDLMVQRLSLLFSSFTTSCQLKVKEMVKNFVHDGMSFHNTKVPIKKHLKSIIPKRITCSTKLYKGPENLQVLVIGEGDENIPLEISTEGIQIDKHTQAILDQLPPLDPYLKSECIRFAATLRKHIMGATEKHFMFSVKFREAVKSAFYLENAARFGSLDHLSFMKVAELDYCPEIMELATEDESPYTVAAAYRNWVLEHFEIFKQNKISDELSAFCRLKHEESKSIALYAKNLQGTTSPNVLAAEQACITFLSRMIFALCPSLEGFQIASLIFEEYLTLGLPSLMRFKLGQVTHFIQKNENLSEIIMTSMAAANGIRKTFDFNPDL